MPAKIAPRRQNGYRRLCNRFFHNDLRRYMRSGPTAKSAGKRAVSAGEQMLTSGPM